MLLLHYYDDHYTVLVWNIDACLKFPAVRINSLIKVNFCWLPFQSELLLHLRNTSCASIDLDSRDLCGRIMRPAWLKTRSLAAELHGAQNSWRAIGRRLLAYTGSQNVFIPTVVALSKCWYSPATSTCSGICLSVLGGACSDMKSNSLSFFADPWCGPPRK